MFRGGLKMKTFITLFTLTSVFCLFTTCFANSENSVKISWQASNVKISKDAKTQITDLISDHFDLKSKDTPYRKIKIRIISKSEQGYTLTATLLHRKIYLGETFNVTIDNSLENINSVKDEPK
jgi:hypothetical protein